MTISKLPTLDLHGESRDIAIILAQDFINSYYQISTKEIIIIHGMGKGILKKAILEVVKTNKLVKDFYYDFFNLGCIHIILKENQKKI
jgi:dsDNA-specific endonuclease/ATPase MutS2